MNRCSFPRLLGVTLSEFVDNRLEAYLWHQMSNHIAECEICQKEVEDLRRSMEALRGIPQPDPGPAFNAAVLERMEAARPAQEARERRMTLRFRLVGAFAALVFLALIAIPLYVANIKRFVGRQDVYVIGRETLIPGSTASLRVVVANRGADNPVRGAYVRLFLEPKKSGRRIQLFSGRTNEAGTFDGNFKVPADISGPYRLIAAPSSYLGKDQVTFDVSLKRQAKVLLTTDKPVYQPGQVIHIRTLSLLRPSLAPASGDRVEIAVEDPKGNRVFKRVVTASRFGVAAADFQLGEELNLGTYKIKAALGDVQSEKVVTVKRYVLPKFKVELKTDKSYYAPGETIRGTVTARYFFGKPVDFANVEVVLRSLDVRYEHFADVEGRTDAGGIFTFERKLPDKLVGQPLEQGNALVQIEVGVIDRATHREEIVRTVPVAKDPIRIAVVPESGQLAPGLENIIYVVTSYPDGRAAKTTVAVSGDGINNSAGTDGLGIAAFPVRVPEDGGVSFKVTAIDPSGETSTQAFTVPVRPDLAERVSPYALDQTGVRDPRQLGSVLVRTDKAVYDSGDTVRLAVLSTRGNGPVYIDVVRDGQTVLTKTIYLKNGRAEEEFDLSKDFAGTVTFSAYVLCPLGSPVRDTATVFVREANELSVTVTPDKEIYRPGDMASLRFRVTDRSGRGVISAIGLDVVDESVFSVEEQAPGLAALYFSLQEEILKPRCQIKEFDPYSLDYYRSPGDSARKMQSEILRPESQAKGELPGYIDPRGLLTDGMRKRGETVQRAAKVLFAGAVYAGEGVVTAETAQERDRQTSTAQRYFFEGMAPLWWMFGPVILFASVCTVVSFRRRKLLPFALSALPILALVVVEAAELWVSLGGELWLSEYCVCILLASLPVGIVGAVLVWERSRLAIGMGLFGFSLVWAAIIFPVFARAREAGRSTSLASSLKGIGCVLEEGQSYDQPSVVPQTTEGVATPSTSSTPLRVRQFFPETLFSAPEIITDEQGRGKVDIPIADSITTWRASALVSSPNGQIGSATAGIRVFQDFFVDMDLPVGLTVGDRIEVPVAVYNYLPESQTIRITLKEGDWFRLQGPDTREIKLVANEVGVINFPIVAEKFGKHSLTVEASGAALADAVRREITIWPNGQEQSQVVGGRVSGSERATVDIPSYAIRGTPKLLVRVYPGVYSQVVEGLEGLLQVPYGCFEQTSSVTYPNVLVLQYLKAAKKDNPKAVMKAEQYINLGYQRLLTFEVKGGGFDWYGDPPANTVLTAYGVMELADMAKVYDVDKRLIERARGLLSSRQHGNGSWTEEHSVYSWSQVDSALPVTAYVTWALAEAGYADSAEVRSGADYLTEHLLEVHDSYVLALTANALVAAQPDTDAARRAVNRLADAARIANGRARWTSRLSTLTYGAADVADTETTALAAYALLRDGRQSRLAEQALNGLVASKRADGSWGTTQATILALKALVLGSTTSVGGSDSEVEVFVNGKRAGTVEMTGDGAEVTHVVDVTRFARSGRNTVEMRVHGKAMPAYQVTAKYYISWSKVARTEAEPIKIEVDYGTGRLRRDSVADLTAKVMSRQPVRMAIVDLGIPPGFGVMAEDLDALKGKKIIDRYELTGRQIILYLRNLSPRRPVTIHCRLRALYPVMVSTPASRAYDYYNPERVKGIARPVVVRVD